MEPLYAKYPFLSAARAAVEAVDVDLPTVIFEEPPVVERALSRVRHAIEDGTIGPQHRSTRVEVLSYPIARVMVSLVSDPGLIQRYAHAEAHTAHERFLADIRATETGVRLESVEPTHITLDDLLAEFSLADAVQEGSDGYEMEVGAFLGLAENQQGDHWHLINRTLRHGRVHITQEELYLLLRDAVRDRVQEGLPVDVPDPVAESLADAVGEIQAQLMDHVPAREFDEIDPAVFPPCMKALLDRVADGERLPAHSQFTITSFLSTVGLSNDQIVERTTPEGESGDRAQYQLPHLREDGEPSVYPPVSCPAMVAYGDCVNKDALCEQVTHPLEYYERRLAGDTPEDYVSRDESQ